MEAQNSICCSYQIRHDNITRIKVGKTYTVSTNRQKIIVTSGTIIFLTKQHIVNYDAKTVINIDHISSYVTTIVTT